MANNIDPPDPPPWAPTEEEWDKWKDKNSSKPVQVDPYDSNPYKTRTGVTGTAKMDELSAERAREKRRTEYTKEIFASKENWDGETGKFIPPKEKSVANKFLPFIVEKSTPINIYSTLLSRSKGMNTTIVASVFYLVLAEGILKVRDMVKRMPEMGLDQLYEELIVQNNFYRVDDTDIQIVVDIIPYLNQTDDQGWADELNEFEIKDIMIFLLVMALYGKEMDYCDYPIKKLMTDKDDVLHHIPDYVKFSDIGQKWEFNSGNSLKAFILYRAFFCPDDDIEICATFNSGAGDDNVPL